jgi:AcrR family transcriptional regulator
MGTPEMTTTIDTGRAEPRAPARRTRPRGLSALHQEQIEDSQQRILAAAALAFTRNSYNATPVDTIISIAGVSRATFYKYFTSKFDVAKGLIAAFMPRLTAVFDALPDRPTGLEAQAWLYKLLKLYEDNRQATTLFGEVGGSEPGFFPEMIAFHDGLLAHLGKRIPAFAKAASGLPEHASAHLVAHLCIQHLFGFCTNVVSKGWAIDVEAGVRHLADELVRFISENE